ncbi:ubiquitin-like-specific protease ESD4 [Tasmannia lanceolata]|uniref:ubiquitin-like-specific protease ESD4 n=1 Tax=Tasmannia lanceolata TaxID=3420 RepID=UPI004062ECED
MGALTESRKRLNSDFASSSFFPPYSCGAEYSIDLPVLKKSRISPMPSTPEQNILVQTSEIPVSRFRNFPPPLPLPRPVHAPQRNLKFFRSANLISNSQPVVNRVFERGDRVVGMGVALTMIGTRLKERKDSAFNSAKLWRKGKTVMIDDDTDHSKVVLAEGLGVEEYRRMVDKQEGLSKVSDHIDVRDDVCLTVPSRRSSSDVSELTILIPEEDVSGKLEDSPLANHTVEEWTNRSPFYKRLHESSQKRDSKLSTLVHQIRLNEAKWAAWKLIKVVPEEVKEDVTREPFIPLTDAEIDVVSCALSSTLKRRELLVVHESSNIQITRDVLQCLQPGAWLNDEVINLYLELLKEREKSDPKKFLKCHFFNTFFYNKLFSGRHVYDFKAVRRWTTQRKIGYGLIECDKIFVPIHKEIHWCLAVINIKDEKFQYLDSLGGKDTQVLKVLARYFVDEVKDKNGKDVNVSSWKQEFVHDLPEQLNGYDCGMFMIKYADFYSRGFELCFSQEHMPYFRQRTAKEILALKAD